jgi:hypothetical protein
MRRVPLSVIENTHKEPLLPEQMVHVRITCLIQAQHNGGTEEEVLARARRYIAFALGETENSGVR